MSFNMRLSELRKKFNLSQSVLAKKIGVHQNVIGRYERGEARPSIELALKLADVFEVSLDYLVGKTNMEVDENILAQVLTIQKLPAKEKEHILYTLHALIRDAKTQHAYS